MLVFSYVNGDLSSCILMGTYIYIYFSALKVSLSSYCFIHFLSPLLILIDLCTEESQDYLSILLCAYKLQSQRERKKRVFFAIFFFFFFFHSSKYCFFTSANLHHFSIVVRISDKKVCVASDLHGISAAKL